jgi:hypothetical protein
MGLRNKIAFIYNIIGIRFRWLLFSHVRGWKGITDVEYDREVIVSLTSFPNRINDVSETIKSLLIQSMKPNKIILWLADSQFENKEEDLPYNLLKLRKYGLDIYWYDDIKSYKKLIPALIKYPEAIIVTADDDIYYRHDWLLKLYEGYLSDKHAVWAHRVTKFLIYNESYIIKTGGCECWKGGSYLNKITGCGGVLYPPHCFSTEAIKRVLFEKLCYTNDDIWFWLMAVLNGTKVKVPKNPQIELLYVGKTQLGPTLTSINDRGEKMFWKNFYSVLEYYPSIDERLHEEFYGRLNNGY